MQTVDLGQGLGVGEVTLFIRGFSMSRQGTSPW